MTTGAAIGVLLLRWGLWCPLTFSAIVGAASAMALRLGGIRKERDAAHRGFDGSRNFTTD